MGCTQMQGMTGKSEEMNKLEELERIISTNRAIRVDPYPGLPAHLQPVGAPPSLMDAVDKNRKLEGYLCAVLRGTDGYIYNLPEFLEDVEKEGDCPGLVQWWEDHCRADEERIKKDLGKYSKHELNLIREILKEDE